jgi:superfamily II DNA/RNA helicase
VQQQVIPPALEGRDLLVSAATGSGKTAAFLLPMLQRFLDQPRPQGGTRALALVPTRELARQVLNQFMQLASYTRAFAGVITGGAPMRHQIADLRRNPELLIATPGRLLEHLERGSADLGDLELLVLDEADRMLDMGFAVEVLSIIGSCSSGRQSLLFSATLNHRGLKPITDRLLRDPLVVAANPVREQHPDIRHQVLLADDPGHKQRQLLWLLAHEDFDRALVFVNSREQAGALGAFLAAQGLRAGVLHGELDQRERNRVMGLLRSGQIRVLVGTDLAARGLDLEGLELVVNFELARSGDDYLHRTGRTGRAGRQGLAISLVSAPEWNRAGSIERYLRLIFERRAIPGLEARFRGPKRQRGSGQAAGKKPPQRLAAKKKFKARPKRRERDRKDKGKPRRLKRGYDET